MMETRASDSFTTGLCLLIALALSACSTPAPPSRYSQKHDAAPPARLHPDQIKDAVPRPEEIRAAGNYSPYEVLGKTYRVMSERAAHNFREQGTASWYGSKFHGHLTSNGEVYDMYAMSAAHKSLPIPCYVRVTNLDNGRSTIVRVNDRGPFHGDRIIDLSYAAATKLDYAQRGVARVKIEVIDTSAMRVGPSELLADTLREPVSGPPAKTVDGGPVQPQRYLQAAAFGERTLAEAYRDRLASMLEMPVTITSRTGQTQMLHRVRIGPLSGTADTNRIRELLRMQNLGVPHLVVD